MSCKCGSDRMMRISGKCSDCFNLHTDNVGYNGYVPYDMNIGGGDYLEMNICLDCGKVQGDFPISNEHIKTKTND